MVGPDQLCHAALLIGAGACKPPALCACHLIQTINIYTAKSMIHANRLPKAARLAEASSPRLIARRGKDGRGMDRITDRSSGGVILRRRIPDAT